MNNFKEIILKKDTIIMILKRFMINMLMRHRKLLICIACFLVILNLVNSLFGNTTKNKINADKFDDINVNSNNYANEFREFNNMKKEFKSKRDIENKDLKYVLPNSRVSNTQNYLIYEYTKIFGESKFCDKTPLVDECPYKNCQFTCDQSQLPQSNVVLFHEVDLQNNLMFNPFYLDKALNVRKTTDIWLLWNDEANPVKDAIDKYNFNWTISYRHDAEVSDCSYGCKYEISNERDSKLIMSQIRSEFIRRKNVALGLISNCASHFRIKLAKSINENYPVHILGKCSNLIGLSNTFPFLSPTSLITRFIGFFLGLTSASCPRDSNCELDLLTKHKFFLAFESKNCSFYITEKFWRTLRLGLIPIVFQPQKQFYESIAPPNSFIHAQDFNFDTKKLSLYLNRVSYDVELYASYHKWRIAHDVVFTGRKSEPRRICELCTRLNTETSTIYYKSISKWFNNNCIIN